MAVQSINRKGLTYVKQREEEEKEEGGLESWASERCFINSA